MSTLDAHVCPWSQGICRGLNTPLKAWVTGCLQFLLVCFTINTQCVFTLCVCLCAHVHPCAERSERDVGYLPLFHITALKLSLSLDQKLTIWARLAGQQALGTHQSPLDKARVTGTHSHVQSLTWLLGI